MCKISIIIPVYNANKSLHRCLNSIINQSYNDFEIICINDGSKDNSLEILNFYTTEDSRIRVIDQENSGPAMARHKGLDIAQGKYIMFCDADDWYEPKMLEKMISTIEDKNVDLVMCDTNIINESNTEIERCKYDNFAHKLNIKEYADINKDIIKEINVVLWNKIFKKEILDNFNIKYPTKYEHDDSMFFYKYIICCKNYYGLDEKLYNYVIGNPNSIMGQVINCTNNGRQFDFIFAWQNFWDFFNSNNFSNEYKNFFVIANCNSIAHFYRLLILEDRTKAFELIKDYINKNNFLLINKDFKVLSKKNKFSKFDKYYFEDHVSFLQKIFSIRKDKLKTHKILRILGFKIKFKIKRFNSIIN